MFAGNRHINSMSANDFSFYAMPEKRSAADYEEIYQKIRAVCSKNKAVLSVYTFGEVKVPGISDIDLIFILRKGSKLPRFLRKTCLDGSSNYILVHPFFIVTENFMENISYIYPNAKLNLIYGKKIKIKKLPKSELDLVYRYLINDVILRHFPSDYLNVLLSKRINARMGLLRLNSLHHSFGIFRKISGVNKKEWENISDKVEELRKKWFKMASGDAKSELLYLMKRAVYVSLDFVREYSRFIESKVPETGFSELLFKGVQNRISFAENFEVQDSLAKMIAHYSRHKNFYSLFPKALAWQLCAYSSARGPLSAYISGRIDKKCAIKNIDSVLGKRIWLLNCQVEYAMRLHHSHYPCSFPLGFKNTKGLKNKLIYAYVLVKDHSLFRRAVSYIRTSLRPGPV